LLMLQTLLRSWEIKKGAAKRVPTHQYRYHQ
jgi:hypothetical protein